jgi:20S proteasome subunit beta 2
VKVWPTSARSARLCYALIALSRFKLRMAEFVSITVRYLAYMLAAWTSRHAVLLATALWIACLLGAQLVGGSPANVCGATHFQEFATTVVPSASGGTLKTGTTIVGICCKDGVVLGADTRSTGGPLVMDKNKRKIHTVSSNIMACAAGTSADCDQLTRRAGHFLQLVRIEKELAGEDELYDPVVTAVTSLSNAVRECNARPVGRKTQAVIIVGGMDSTGPGLFQLGAEGVPTRVTFGALGSGCTDALAVLEQARRDWLKGAETSTVPLFVENVNVKDAVATVRRAVQAGILNDLGSGSHVDLCVITAEGSRTWRETQVSSWDKDRLDPTPQERVVVSAKEGDLDAGFKSSIDDVGYPLGRRVFTRMRLRKRLTSEGTVVEDYGTASIDGDLSLNIDMIE